MRFVFDATSTLGGTDRGETLALGVEAGVEGKDFIDPFDEVYAFRKKIGGEIGGLKGPVDNVYISNVPVAVVDKIFELCVQEVVWEGGCIASADGCCKTLGDGKVIDK